MKTTLMVFNIQWTFTLSTFRFHGLLFASHSYGFFLSHFSSCDHTVHFSFGFIYTINKRMKRLQLKNYAEMQGNENRQNGVWDGEEKENRERKRKRKRHGEWEWEREIAEEKWTLNKWKQEHIWKQPKQVHSDMLTDSYTCTIKNHNGPDIMSNL